METGSTLGLADWPILLNQSAPGSVKDKTRQRVPKEELGL